MNGLKQYQDILKSFSDANVMVVGDIMLDRYFWGEASRISPEAPVPVVKVKKKTRSLGGAGNVAANLSGLGCNTAIIGVCGSGNAGKQLKEMIINLGVDDQIIEDPSRPTITKTRVMAAKQQALRLDEEKTGSISPDVQKEILFRLQKRINTCKAVVLSDYGKSVFLSTTFTQKVIEMCRHRKVPVFVDPKGSQWGKYKNATCITPNTAEFELVTGGSPDNQKQAFFACAKALREKTSIDWLLITRGPRGMSLVGGEDKPFVVPARAREVFDVSGAGDTVIATMAAAVASGLDFFKAAEMANMAAGVVVGKLGTRPINRQELFAALNSYDAGKRFFPIIENSDYSDVGAQAEKWRSAGETIVFTNGCFDLLHPGHVSLLRQAKALGHRLIVGLNSDASVKRLKGESRPILVEKDRAAVLSALESVDMVALFGEDTPRQLIKAVKPDILVKGADYAIDDVVGKNIVQAYGGRVALVDILKGHSTTTIAEKISANKNNHS